MNAFLTNLLQLFPDALAQLEVSLAYCAGELALDPGLFLQFRTAAIQCFAYSYELAHRSIRRALTQRAASPEEIATLDDKEVIRHAARAGMAIEVERWFALRVLRNKTSHAYAGDVAAAVYSELPAFLTDAKRLLVSLRGFEAK